MARPPWIPEILSPDIYDMVVVSSFGQVVQKHLDEDGRDEEVMVHPVTMFVLCLPLFIGQLSVLVFLNLDYDFTKPVKIVSGDPEMDKLLHIVKLMMVLIVQLVMFSKILGSLRILVFLLTPSTWDQDVVQRRRPKDVSCSERVHAGMQMIFSAWCVFPPAVSACFFHAMVDYSICMSSISIILNANSMTEAVYNSLAISFLSDIPAQRWSVLRLIFHMEAVEPFFRKAGKSAEATGSRAPLLGGPEQSEPGRTDTCKEERCVSAECFSVRGVQTVVTSLVMFLICARQCFIVGLAVNTNVLPVARDVCSWWRFDRGEDWWHFNRPVWWFMEVLVNLVASPQKAILQAADPGSEPPGYCDGSYHDLFWDDIFELPRKYPIRTAQCVAVAAVTLAAQIVYHCNANIRDRLYLEQGAAGYREVEDVDKLSTDRSDSRRPLTACSSPELASGGDVRQQLAEMQQALERERSSRLALQQELAEERQAREALAQRLGELARTLEAAR